MEKLIQIKTADNKIIEGILLGPLEKPLIVLIHGLAGNMNEAMHYNAARYFEEHGFSTFRFNLYSFNKGNRKLHECTFKTHGSDIDTVLKYLRNKGAKKIFLVGHSFGWPSILYATSKDFLAAVSWDGSCLPNKFLDQTAKVRQFNARVIDEGYFVLMGEENAREEKTVNSIELIKNFNKPVKFITAEGKSSAVNMVVGKKMFKAAKGKKAFATIKGASHCFVEDGKQEQLYKETINWLKEF